MDKSLSKLFKWVGFGIAFAFIPFSLSWWNLSHHGHIRTYFYQLWPHGELAIVCVALAADGLGEIVFDGKKKRDAVKVCGAIGCTLILVLGSFLFAGAQSLADNSPVGDLKDYSFASVVLFGVTLIVAGICKIRTEA